MKYYEVDGFYISETQLVNSVIDILKYNPSFFYQNLDSKLYQIMKDKQEQLNRKKRVKKALKKI